MARRLDLSRELTTEQLARLSRELMMLFRSGIGITQGLELVAARNRPLRNVLIEMADAIRHGETFNQALREQGRRFPPEFVGLVNTGERTGTLVEMLRELADYYEENARIRRSFIRALTYPALVVLAALVIIPIFQQAGFGYVAGKDATSILGGLGYAFGRFGLRVLIVIAAIFVLRRVGVFRWLRQEVFARIWPFNTFMRRMAISRFARSLALMSNCGINMEPALRQSALASGLRVIERDILRAIPAIRQGRPLHEALQHVRCLSPMFHEMVYVGEQSGSIGHVLRQVAQDGQEEVRHRLIILASSVEGIIIICIGLALVRGHFTGLARPLMRWMNWL